MSVKMSLIYRKHDIDDDSWSLTLSSMSFWRNQEKLALMEADQYLQKMHIKHDAMGWWPVDQSWAIKNATLLW